MVTVADETDMHRWTERLMGFTGNRFDDDISEPLSDGIRSQIVRFEAHLRIERTAGVRCSPSVPVLESPSSSV
jgi:hypothetical protein